jgi:hypothetical protein
MAHSACNPDPQLGILGVRALFELADFCEAYQVRRQREEGHTWGRIATFAGVNAQALHKKYAQSFRGTDN